MKIFSLADKYTVLTKSILVDILTALDDEDFQRSQSKEELLEHVNNYFVPDVLEHADLKALTQLANMVAIEVKGKKSRRERYCIALTNLQNDMKDRALVAIQEIPETSPEFTTYARIIFTTDPELHEQWTNLMESDSAEDESN